MAKTDYDWAIPFMRAGYTGRGITYLAIAGLSLWAIWRGGQAQGTGNVLQSLGQSAWGVAVLVVIALGLFAYAIWRLIDAAADLEDYGSDGKGAVARAGMVVTGLLHGLIGVLAITIIFSAAQSGGGGGEGGINQMTRTVLNYPGGRILVGIAALCIIGAGIYYLQKAWKSGYREHLRANRFTSNWDWALKAGVASQGVIVLIIGFFFGAAALSDQGGEAGGIGQAFDWLASQPFGNFLVILVCIGLLGFAFFCFVNAAYRIVPKAAGDDIETLAHKAKAKARAATH